MRTFAVTLDIDTDSMSEDDVQEAVCAALSHLPMEPYIDFSDVRVDLVYEDME